MNHWKLHRATITLIIPLALVLAACGQAATTGRATAIPTTSAASSAPTRPPAATAAVPTEPPAATAAATGATQAPRGNVMTTASGLQYIELAAGSGPTPKPGELVSVHYTGTLTDGTVFDSSYQRNEPITFPIGRRQVIPGWDEGIGLMKKGGKARLIIPPDLAYGAQGAGGVIPPNATLIFEVELVDINAAPPPPPDAPTKVDQSKYITTPSGLKYYDLKVGDGPTPQKGATVNVHYTGWLTDGKMFDSSLTRGQPFSFTLRANQVIPGWDEGVATVKVCGGRRLVIPAN